MLTLAAAVAPTAAERFRQIPLEFWWKFAVGVAAFIALVIILRKVAKMNKVVLAIIAVVSLSFVGFNWIYERNEPAWASQAVNWLAGFLPSKGTYDKNR